MTNNIFLIDICGTLFRSNTTMDFIKFLYSNKRWFRYLNRIKSTKLVGYLNTKIFYWFHIDLLRMYAIYHLKGLTKDEIERESKAFYDNYLNNTKNDSVIEIINSIIDTGITPVITSATLDCISKEVSSRLGITKQLSSTLEYKNGICTGKIKNDLLSAKLKNLRKEGYNSPFHTIITDNYSDADIIQNSKNVYLINYGKNTTKWLKYISQTKFSECKIIYIDHE